MESVLARAPARASLAGGGTDLPAYADRFGGAVVSFALDVHATVVVSAKPDGVELVSLDAGTREFIPAAAAARRLRPPILAEEHVLFPKAVAARFRLERARIEVASDIPVGAGLASSGALAVAACAAVATFVGEHPDAAKIAEDAFDVEASFLARACGRQDQYASAFGGINLIEFTAIGTTVTPLAVDPIALAQRVLLFAEGSRRDAAVPLRDQAQRTATGDATTLDALHALKDAAYVMRAHLEDGDLDAAGRLLDETWKYKRLLHAAVSDLRVDEAYGRARAAGALGAKLAGAGTAGTLMAFAAEGTADLIREAMADIGWVEIPCAVAEHGVVIEMIEEVARG